MSPKVPHVSVAPTVLGVFPEPGHDHAHCVDMALKQAESICQERGARLTDVRHRVLELVWRNHRPVGAYEILEHLGNSRKRAQPPTVYRALEFLLAQGLIHRIESLNAYIGCTAPERDHDGQFLICRDCGATAELLDRRIDTAIHAGASAAGFTVEHPTVELEGLCAKCRSHDHHD